MTDKRQMSNVNAIHDYRIYYVNIDLGHAVWSFCRWVADVPPVETSLAATEVQGEMAVFAG